MTLRRVAAAIAAIACLLSGAGAAAQDQTVRNLVIAADPAPFTGDDLLWMEVRSGDYLLAESVNVYGSRAGVFIPIGEFSRVLDLAIGVFPAQRRAEGWVLSPDRRVTVDLGAGQATVAGRSFAITSEQAVIYGDDLYLRTDLLEQLIPVRLAPDVNAQVLELTALEPLPFQQRAARLQRQAGVRSPALESAVRVDTPYRLFTPPNFDVNIGGLLTRDGVDQASRFDVRAAGDLFHAGFEGFVGSDDDGDISDVRVTLSRKDAGGRALGPLGGTRAGVGDVFTPSLAIGAASFDGRGVFYTSAPLESLDIGTPLDLRGELPVGEEVELYVNEVLQASQSTADQGRYEFLDVPLAFGLNTVRLVFYGSHGETREVVRRINFGSGQVEAGRLVFRFGAVEQGRAVFEVGDDDDPLGLDVEAPRFVAALDYGLSPGLTLSAGLARYTPQGEDGRSMATVGLRGSLLAAALQADLALDDQGGQGLSLGMAARPWGVSIIGRHSEYRGDFLDETRQLGVTALAPLRRASDVRADTQISGPGGLVVPVSLSARRLERVDGSRLVNAEARVSAPVGRFYASSSIIYEDETRADGSGLERTAGSTDIATLVFSRLQLRGGVAYDISPDPEVESAYATADWQITPAQALRLGVIHTLGPEALTSVQASHLWRADRFDLSLNAGFDVETGDWRAGLQLGFGFGYVPSASRYRMVRPGVAAGGSVAVNAWVDENGDGRRQPGEPGVPGLVVDTPTGAASSGDDGQVFISGLGDPPTARIRLNMEGVEDPFLVGGPTVVEIEPRPGRTAAIDYPMQRSAEIELKVELAAADGPPRPLAAVNVELVSPSGEVIAGRSDHAGVLFLESARPGTYTVRLQADQARALGLAMVRPVEVIVPPSGGFVRGGAVQVRIEQGAAQ